MMTPEMIGKVESYLGYTFGDERFLIRALTSKAYALEQAQQGKICEHQKIYCTLGDTILKAVLVEILIKRGYATPSAITEKKQALESRANLAKMSPALAIVPFIRFGVGERHQQIYHQPSVIAETFEALIAAIYQDGGWEMIRKLIEKWFSDLID